MMRCRLYEVRCFMYVQKRFIELCLMLGHPSKDSRQTRKSKILEHSHVLVTASVRDRLSD